jgi:hypothetical protein
VLRPEHNLPFRSGDFKNGVLRFVSNPKVAFSNNLAKQDIRMMKVKLETSGGFPTNARPEIRVAAPGSLFAALRRVIATARKQGWNIQKTCFPHQKPSQPGSQPKKTGLGITISYPYGNISATISEV